MDKLNLSKGMRQLNGPYTQRFNRRHDLACLGIFINVVIKRYWYKKKLLAELTRYAKVRAYLSGAYSMAENG